MKTLTSPSRLEWSAILCALLAPLASAGPATSTDYRVITDTLDSAGNRSSSANYTQVGSMGGIVGISSAIPGSTTNKTSYIAQLSDPTALQITAPSPTLPEGSTLQLSATLSFDDGTATVLSPASVAWGIVSGPLSSISTGGLATAAIVYQDGSAVVKGDHAGFSASLALEILNVNIDNFGSYAADGIDDAWQVQYFGLDNPMAGPLIDPDHDGQNNLFEYTADVDPTDPWSKFRLTIEPVPGEAQKKKLIFSPIRPGRSYVVEYSAQLISWDDLTGFSSLDFLPERQVIDNAATPAKRFYRVRIEIE